MFLCFGVIVYLSNFTNYLALKKFLTVKNITQKLITILKARSVYSQ